MRSILVRGSSFCRLPLFLLLLCPIPVSADPARVLSFEERVAAQAAIERVYHAHQEGTSRSFAEAVPREVLERRVRDYLRKSAALEQRWGGPVTREALSVELQRIARHTRFPDRLREIYDALGNDSFLLQECFARRVLVERLIRARFAHDPAIHGDARADAEALRQNLIDGGYSIHDVHPRRRVIQVARPTIEDADAPAPVTGGGRARTRFLDPRGFSPAGAQASVPGPVVENPEAFRFQVVLEEDQGDAQVAVYTFPKPGWDEWWAQAGGTYSTDGVRAVADGTLPIPSPSGHPAAFSSYAEAAESSANACNGDDTWDSSGTGFIPVPRLIHSAVWTGTEMIVWGGLDGIIFLDDGGRYDPLTDTWEPLSRTGAPAARGDHSAVWTGDRMVVWGGTEDLNTAINTGGSYDPATDTWATISTAGVPQGRQEHTAVWTGTEMIVWGGRDSANVSGGSAYDPSSDTWRTLPSAGEPVPRTGHTALWTGAEMIIWGGSSADAGAGGRYDPLSDTWAPLSAAGQPSGRYQSAVWTGSEMITWSADHGARYSPASDTWTPISTAGDPEFRIDQSAVWAGTEMVVWGGNTNPIQVGSDFVETGGRYDPATDTWTPTTLVGAPNGRVWGTTVWTGSEMIIWGGRDKLEWTTSSGGRYDPSTDTWTPTNAQVPIPRTYHTGVWTGNELVIWGGADSRLLREPTSLLSDGARYDPLADAWTPISSLGAPAGRVLHTAVWTGSQMIVWGGEDLDDQAKNSGGRYDPSSDTWSPTSVVGAPPARLGHHAFWTGSEMIVWGGDDGAGPLASGGLYDPSSDTWTATSVVGAPSPRVGEGAVWAGSELIVWGGQDGGVALATGARYSPAADTWTPTGSTGAPAPRYWHAAVWTGSRMMVWGGRLNGSTIHSDGALYDPATDTWAPTSTVGTPEPAGGASGIWTGSEVVISAPYAEFSTAGRYDPALDTWAPVSGTNAPRPRGNAIVAWTGSFVAVWGGDRRSVLNDGARYFVKGFADLDQDGFGCDVDCDDLEGDRFPGNPEVCDGLDNDCDGVLPPGEVDDDGDGAPFCGDCDDADPARFPGNVESCDAVDNDCDTAIDEDDDGDGFAVCVECDDTDPDTYPGAVEVNDGADNQCSGDPGFASVDELEPLSSFQSPGQFCWAAQPGAGGYEMLRSSTPFLGSCAAVGTTQTCAADPVVPGLGAVLYYAAHATAPHVGSAGRTTAGAERPTVCDGEFDCTDGADDDGDGLTDCDDVDDCGATGACAAPAFTFVDGPGDDVSSADLASFFLSLPTIRGYLFLEITGPTITDFAFCTERSDFHRSGYLALAFTGGTVTSGSWNRWFRDEVSTLWTGPFTAGVDNWYGVDCAGPLSWCPEAGFQGRFAGVSPADTALCEVFDFVTCESGMTLTVRVAPDRLSACGF